MINLNEITKNTRRKAYNLVLETLGSRQINVLNELFNMGKEGSTANELAKKMWKLGYFLTTDRNNVHPRLNELVELELVKVVDKKVCSITGRKCAIYVHCLNL